MSYGHRRFVRAAAAGLLVSGVFAVLPTGSASASDAPARSIESACPAGQVPDQGYTDLPSGSDATSTATRQAINCITEYDVAGGFAGDVNGDGRTPDYGPTRDITRGQLASMAMQKLDNVTGFTRPANPPNAFTDDEGDVHEDNINDAAELDIVTGFPGDVNGDGRTPDYGPGQPISRAQMATIVVGQLRAAGATLPAAPGASDSPSFSDVDRNNTHFNNIEILHEMGIFTGSNGQFNPTANLSRAQMALVEARVLAELVDQGKVRSKFGAGANQSFAVSPAATQVQEDDQVAQYRFSGLDAAKRYEVSLFPCGVEDEGTVIFNDGDAVINRNGGSVLTGNITFLDGDGGPGGVPDDEPDYPDQTENGNAFISLINLSPAGGGTHESDLQPRNDGTLDVVLASNGADCAIPVLWEEANDGSSTDDGELDLGDRNPATLENVNTPVEKFRVGPAAVWHEGHAPNGEQNSEEVVLFRGASSLFGGLLGSDDTVGVVLSDGFLYGIAPSDGFHYDGAEVEGPISQTNFFNWLTIADELATCDNDDACNDLDQPYTRTGKNQWALQDDDEGETVFTPPTNPQGTAGNFDGGSTNNDIQFSWTAPVYDGAIPADVDEYCWELYNVTNPGAGPAAQDCTDEADTLNQTGDVPTNTAQGSGTTDDVHAFDVAQGTYRFRVYAESETDDESSWSLWSEPINVLGGTDTTAPVILDSRAAAPPGQGNGDTGFSGLFDPDPNSEWHRFVFSERMDPRVAEDGSTYRVTDPDGTTFDIVCNGDGAPSGADGCFLNSEGGTDPGTGFTFGPEQIMFVRINDNAGDPFAAKTSADVANGSVAGRSYPLTITAVSDTWDDVAGNQLNLAGSDKVIQSDSA